MMGVSHSLFPPGDLIVIVMGRGVMSGRL
jgi:hypothetical protein